LPEEKVNSTETGTPAVKVDINGWIIGIKHILLVLGVVKKS
jgi:hypothetical protein